MGSVLISFGANLAAPAVHAQLGDNMLNHYYLKIYISTLLCSELFIFHSLEGGLTFSSPYLEVFNIM